MRLLYVIKHALVRFSNYYWRNLSIKSRLMTFLSIAILLPLLSISFVSYRRFSAYAEEVTITHKFDLIFNNLDEIITNKARDERLSDQIQLNRYIQDALTGVNEPEDDYLRFYGKEQIRSLIYSMLDQDNVQGITIIGENGKVFNSGMENFISSDLSSFKDTIAYDSILKSTGNNIWVPLNKDIFAFPSSGNQVKPSIYLIRKLSHMENTKIKIGITVIEINYDRFLKRLQAASNGKGEYSVLVDSDGVILCDTGTDENIGKSLDSGLLENVIAQKGSFHEIIQDRDFLVIYTRNNNSGWSLIHCIPYENILDRTKEIRNYTIIAMLVCMFVAMLFSIYLSRNITNPIIKLKRLMNKFGEGRLDISIKDDREDELGSLQQSFNTMADEIRILLKKIDEEHKEKRMLELNVLQYQINPHFLYNTLDSINWMAQKGGNDDVSEIVTALARFFRIGLSKGNEYIKVKDEVEHVYNYLLICKIRYKDCFNIKLDIDDAILNCKTIKVILQPIVENSIKHGIDKDGKSGLIEINGRIEGGDVLLRVCDNGKGIDEETINRINRTLKHDNYADNIDSVENGIGLINVNRRIQLNYGENFGITIKSTLGEGTMVYIRIPYNKQ